MQLLITRLYDIRWVWLINISSRYLPSSALQGTLEALLFAKLNMYFFSWARLFSSSAWSPKANYVTLKMQETGPMVYSPYPRRYPTLLYPTLPYSTLLCSVLLYSTLLCSTLHYISLLCSTLRYAMLLYSALLYYTRLLYSTLLYSSLSYSTVLYSTLPFPTLPFRI